MKRFALLVALAAFLPLLAACSSCPDARVSAAPPDCRPVYSPPCPGGNYDPANLPAYEEKSVRCPLRGLGIPGLECASPVPSSVALQPECVPPPVRMAAPAPTCDPADLPKDAKPGDVFCCVFVQPPAGPAVQVAEARAEWQKADCGPGTGDCWRLIPIPAVFSAPPPPPGYWEWRLNPSCAAPVVKTAPPCVPSGK